MHSIIGKGPMQGRKFTADISDIILNPGGKQNGRINLANKFPLVKNKQ